MKIYQLLSLALFLAAIVIAPQSCYQEARAGDIEMMAGTDAKLQWSTIAELPQLQKSGKKKILIDVYTDWCKWCKVMDEKTFSDESLSAYLRDGYHLVKFNAEDRQEISFQGATYKFKGNGQRGYHELAAKLLSGRLGYPSLVVLDQDLKTVKVIRGYKDPVALRAELEQSAAPAGR